MKFGVCVFPGSNCDADSYYAVTEVLGQSARYIWHQDTSLGDVDAVILPGGFSYGDYLRCGAIARFSPVMQAVERFARDGGLVIGICNGFQVLCEAHLLPGALVRNDGLRFICRHVNLRVATRETPFTAECQPGDVLNIPIAHGEGKYICDADTLAQLQQEDRIVFQYCDPNGALSEAANPNGSLHNIAGICNAGRNVLGMMPHPERACDMRLGSADGAVILQSMINQALTASAR